MERYIQGCGEFIFANNDLCPNKLVDLSVESFKPFKFL